MNVTLTVVIWFAAFLECVVMSSTTSVPLMGRTSREVKEALDEKFSELMYQNPGEEEWCPYICISCDEMIKYRGLRWITDKMLKQQRSLFVEQDYAVVGNLNLRNDYLYPHTKKGHHNWMENLLVSPRCAYRADKKSYSCCGPCKSALEKKKMPIFTIANNNFVGIPPKVLTDLTHVELSFLCPVRTYGYCFTWKGGRNVQLQGTLGYYKVDPSEVARGTTFLESLGANVVVLISGKMTAKQRAKAEEYAKLNVERMCKAVKWLQENNHLWAHVDLEAIREEFTKRQPHLVNQSTVIDDSTDEQAAEREVTERFSIFYPDGEARASTGGQPSMEQFRHMVGQAKAHGFNVEYMCELDREFIKDEKKDNNLVFASLLQFPYGRGGINEIRKNKQGKQVDDGMDVESFVNHLTRHGLPQMHQGLFVLRLYNIGLKKNMIKKASQVIDNGNEAELLVNGVDPDDLERASKAMAKNTTGGSLASRLYLQKVKAVAGSLAHSNEAAGQACMNMESMHHNLGGPHVFCTATMDDENTILMQIYAREYIDDEQDIGSLPDDVLKERAKARSELRIKYPGLAATVFEDILEIIMAEVIGWDTVKNESTGKRGLYGTCFACTYSVEEQGRLTLHAHIIAWIKEMIEAYRQVVSNNNRERERARAYLAKNFDEVCSTNLFGDSNGNTKKRKFLEAFDHDCDVPMDERDLPEVVNNQQLRNLRHKHGHTSQNGVFMYCPCCTSGCRLTNEEAIEQYLIKGVKIPGLTKYPDNYAQGGSNRLQAMIVAHQNPNNDIILDPIVNNAAYNNHLSCHCNTCFKVNKKDPKAKLYASDFECRARLPTLPQEDGTCIKEVNGTTAFTWKGEEQTVYWYQVNPKRQKYDLFQNKGCRPISESKISGNSNTVYLFPGPICMYTCKYYCKKPRGKISRSIQKQ